MSFINRLNRRICFSVRGMLFIVMFTYITITLISFHIFQRRVHGKNIFVNLENHQNLQGQRNIRRKATTECCRNHNLTNQNESLPNNTFVALIPGPGKRPAVKAQLPQNKKRHIPAWKQFLDGISVDEMYSRSSPYMQDLLVYLNRAKIVNATTLNKGTQLKLLLRFEDGNEAVAKPMRHPRDFYWAYNRSQSFDIDEERHTAEIAAFHLDRILDFRKTIPCVGRRVNFTAEILQNTNDPNILGTLQKIDGKTCIIGNCKPWFCNEDHPICAAQGGFMELSVCLKIPGNLHARRNLWSQGFKEALVWKNKNICKGELQKPSRMETRFFLDTIEVALFDHLIVNFDRHHHMAYDGIDINRSFAVLLDNGKGFGNPFKDDITFLAPIYQCCRFRNSTYHHLLSLKGSLGKSMKASLSMDPLAPILTDPFFPALDRRLNQFYDVMERCLQNNGPQLVLV